ncbi:MAG TPA: ABC transporter substrate-binding protein [Lachnospiraceae bacterium]|nr:ABC transporter substrate-binding protein [Lachnospiraceae bacterium]
MKKKVISLLLTAAMSVSLLAGCGSNTPKTTEGDKTVAETDKGDTTTEEYPVIRVPYAVIFDSFDADAIQDALNVILREKAGAEVEFVGIEFGNWSTQLNLMLTGGENSLDLFSSFWYTSVNNLASNGQAIALDDLLASDGQGILDLYNGMEDYLNCGNIKGQVYGIPSIYAWSSENLYLARTEDAEAASIDWNQVHDLDGVTEAMKAMKEVNPDKYYIPGSTDPYWIPKSIDYLGDTNYLGVLADPINSTTIENYYESDYFLDLVDHIKEWKKNDLFSPDPLSNNQPTLMSINLGIANGTPGYSWDAKTSIKSTSAQNGIDLSGAAVTKPLATTGDVTTYMWHISPFCKNPDAAMRVLNVLFTDPEAAELVANGLEGLEYTVDENGQMNYPEGKTMADIGWAAASMAYWPNVTLCKTWSFEPEDIYEQMIQKNKTAGKSLALGFQFDSSSVTDQITACANVVAQYYMPIMYGEIKIDPSLVEFNKQLYAAGLQDIIDAKQEQLDTWLAAR